MNIRGNYIVYVVFIGIFLVFCNPGFASSHEESIQLEADYILACQYINPLDPANGCINNIYGDPTYVVPRENAMAILGLIIASERTGNPIYRERAELSADYLKRIQDITDGAWANQYSYCQIVDYAKSPTQTAEVMIAFYKLGYKPSRYSAMIRGAKFLLECQKLANKGGNDDGLICGGKDEYANWHTWRWTHDNSYAFQAFMAASKWARLKGNSRLSMIYRHSATRILAGINQYLKAPASPAWHIAIDAWGVPQQVWPKSWILWSPVMLNVPADYNKKDVANWIHDEFQMDNGGCIGYDYNNEGELALREYPGITMQACLCWFDLTSIEYISSSYISSSYKWVITSGLWQIKPDGNEISGGFIDWIEIEPNEGLQANWWERYIDTSFYAIAFLSGGYDFSCY